MPERNPETLKVLTQSVSKGGLHCINEWQQAQLCLQGSTFSGK
ncbi:hypothetical protein EV13_2068 [Prochlorococcus sp. MIT 0702]|nr:hypothetical protein EV13_2068 [Prochlorococcus sp. MIT 0702]KGG28228.1 hypothetical protein EV12_0978 [Prochlorococcus sp. MIT 0701]KGG37278.1 hypothetical protein EV14_0070 [Prochlorococcus sp. MIT 0703]